MARSFSLFPLIVLFITSCGSDTSNQQFHQQQSGYDDKMMADPDAQDRTGYNSASNGNSRNQQGGGEQVVMYTVKDPNTGMVSQQIPYPATWKVSEATQGNAPAITGPGGVKVYYWGGEMFTYSNDPYTQQSYQMAGMPMRQPVDINTYVQHDVAQVMGKKGMRLVKQYPLPQVAASNQAYQSQLYSTEPTRDHYWAMGTEWTDAKGEQTFMVVNMRVSQSQSLVFWNTNMQLVSAEKGAMAGAQAALINSIVNTQYNPQQIAAYNASQQQKTSQSWAQHNSRQRENQRHFDQRQQLHRETQDYVNKASTDAYNYRQEVNDGLQHSFNNYINDENTVRDNSTGERYQVQTGANQYWMNNNNEYIQSNDALYNPNADQNVWDQQWKETEIEP